MCGVISLALRTEFNKIENGQQKKHTFNTICKHMQNGIKIARHETEVVILGVSRSQNNRNELRFVCGSLILRLQSSAPPPPVLLFLFLLLTMLTIFFLFCFSSGPYCGKMPFVYYYSLSKVTFCFTVSFQWNIFKTKNQRHEINSVNVRKVGFSYALCVTIIFICLIDSMMVWHCHRI